MRAGVALGANLGNRAARLTTAREMIFALPHVSLPHFSSSLYEAEAVDCEAGAPKFLNAVVEIDYDRSPRGLLDELQKIERKLGRPAKHEPNRSRTIDLDLLYVGGREVDGAALTLPHPGLRLRGFVLQPLAEIRPNLILPNETKTIQQLAEEIPPAPSVVRLAREW
jgi:2-amino-4-hydroxy-6-hydroxymethyldihydropteridine diphosphokinase